LAGGAITPLPHAAVAPGVDLAAAAERGIGGVAAGGDRARRAGQLHLHRLGREATDAGGAVAELAVPAAAPGPDGPVGAQGVGRLVGRGDGGDVAQAGHPDGPEAVATPIDAELAV